MIGGPTTSGKTSIIEKLDQNKYNFISSDDFFESNKDWTNWVDSEYNCNKPESFAADLLISKIKDLQAGKDITYPRHDSLRHPTEPDKYEKNIRVDDAEIRKSKGDIIICEGIHALTDERIRDMADLKIYAYLDDDLRAIYKVMRNIYWKQMVGEPKVEDRQFGGSVPNSFKLWLKSVRPAEKKYILTQEKYGDIIFCNNTWEEVDKNTNLLKELINLFETDKQAYHRRLKQLKEDKKCRHCERLFSNKVDPFEYSKLKAELEALKNAKNLGTDKENLASVPEKSIWKQPTLYYGLVAGTIITLLGAIAIYFFKLKKSNKQSNERQ